MCLTKTETKKEKKLQAIQKSAYELFVDHGIDRTTIDDIVKRAGVAKGTFYLYFKDKEELVEEIVLKKTTQVLEEAMLKVENRPDFSDLSIQDKVIAVVDHILDFLMLNKEFLSIVYKNLSMGLYHMPELTKRAEISKAAQAFVSNVGGDPVRAERKLYLIIELVGSVSYNAILSQIPCSMEELKPDLYEVIGNILY